jgi:hypothetical protein
VSDVPTTETLLDDAAWLKRLAFTLAGNKFDADDLVQGASEGGVMPRTA